MRFLFIIFFFLLSCSSNYIKPKKQTVAPKNPKRKTKKYVNEVMTYVKNTSKWEAANQYANHKGWKFQVWTEETLKNLGIKLLKS